MEERIIILASRIAAGAVVLYTVWSLLLPTLWLLLVVAAAIGGCYAVENHLDFVLPPKGKVVFVTGCDTGIGYSTCVALARRGAAVVAGCLDAASEGAAALAATPGVTVLQCDVTSDDSVMAAMEQTKKICGDNGLWAVVNNAGFNRQAPVELTSLATFRAVSDVMLLGTVRVTKVMLPQVRKARGRVVTMSSDRGMLSPANSAAYCIAKHGVETFSDVLGQEMEQFGVKVGIVQPGHFGAATAIIKPEAMAQQRAAFERDLAACPEEVQAVYGGTKALEAQLASTEASKAVSSTDVSPVVHAILHAVLSARPRRRYAVHGTTSVVDWGIVCGQWKSVMPTWLSDYILGASSKHLN